MTVGNNGSDCTFLGNIANTAKTLFTCLAKIPSAAPDIREIFTSKNLFSYGSRTKGSEIEARGRPSPKILTQKWRQIKKNIINSFTISFIQ